MAQRDTLVKVVRFQDQAAAEMVFGFVPTTQGFNDERDVDVRPLGPDGGETVVTIPGEYIRLWVDLGYIIAGQRQIGGVETGTFILRRKALDLAALLSDQEG